MASEPSTKRAIVFFDGQNLYHGAKEAFGYTYPNYDPAQLAQAICTQQGWQLAEIRFYSSFDEGGGVSDHRIGKSER